MYLPREMHHRDFVKTRNAALFRKMRNCRQRQYTQLSNPTKYPEKGRSKMHAHNKMWKVAGKMMLHTTRDGRRRKSMVRRSKNSQKRKTTITLAAWEPKMTQR